MQLDQDSHLELVAADLRRLDRDPARLAGADTLAGGISGSAVYALRWGGEEFVLKTTLPTSPDGVVARARREALFYEHLAGAIPLRVPAALALASDPSGVAILLPAHRPPLPAEQWNEEASLSVATQLARLHGRFWSDTTIRSRLPWLRWRRTPSPEIGRRHATPSWDTLVQRERSADVLTPSYRRAVQSGLERLEELATTVRRLPLTLCHGDCHRENLLRTADGQLVWADWQEVHLGRGPVDLAFFCERALFDSITLPYDRMLLAYRDGLAERTGRRIRLTTLRSATMAAELLSWLLEWPPFLLQASPDQLARVLDRVQALVGSLDGAA
jgi:hypothetical protein